MTRLIKEEIKKKLSSEYGHLFTEEEINEKQLREKVATILKGIVRNDNVTLSQKEQEDIINEISDELIGLGPIEKLMRNPAVTEIMINGPKRVFVEKNGRIESVDIALEDERQLMHLIYKMLRPTRRRVDESFPYTDVALKDGSRVNIVIPPVALNGPAVTIRRSTGQIKTAEDLIRLGTLDKRMSEFLIACIKSKVNIIFSGATGAGKTTTLGVYSSHISNKERIITIEDTAELHPLQDNVVNLEARTANIEGKGEITIKDLFRNSLRMRPERIILGEIRGAEALDMLQAISSGHTGSLAILHANSPKDIINRLEMMILTSGLPVTLEIIQRQIAAAINLLVHQEQMLDGSRKIINLTQINGIREGQIVLEDIFAYEIENIDAQGIVTGRWKATGVIPVFYQLFKKAGIDVPRELFNKD